MKEITINNKLITNNKLNLPTTWTKKKMASLFLMTWLSVNGTEAGQTFKNCLAVNNDTSSYNLLLNFPFTNSVNIDTDIHVCCTALGCSFRYVGAACNTYYSFICTKISETISCDDNQNCGGIVGDTLITKNTTKNFCSIDINTINSYVEKELNKKFSTYLFLSIPSITPSYEGIFRCGWDNGGWTCQNNNNNCSLQWIASWPGPADKNPLSSTTSSFSLTTTGIFSATTSIISIPASSPSSSDSTKKIFIPVGAVVGTITVGGITYYLYKKRKNKQNRQTNNQDNNSQLFELTNASQPTVKSESTTQPIFTPTPIEPRKQPHSTNLGMPVNWELSAPTEEVSNTDKLETYLGTVIVKSTELSQLVIQVKQKIGPSLAVALETLLDTQTEITHGNNNFAVRQLQREAKEKLLTKLSEEEINYLCQLQKAVVQQEELQAQIEIPSKK